MSITLDCYAARLPELGGSEREVFVLAELLGHRPPGALSEKPYRESMEVESRPPLCLAIAIDASSSMRGPRFALALQSARNVVDSLGPSDRLTVVTFDRGARVIVGPVALDAAGRVTARNALDRLATGVGTNLGAGWTEASESISRLMVPDSERRVLVLTDGYPSRGEMAPEALRARVAEGRANGIETTMVGIGDGIDERLCALLSGAGDGRFHYVRDEAMLGEVIGAEVQGALSIAARGVALSLGLSARVERAEVLHRYPCRPEGRSVEVRVGTVTYASARRVLVAMTLSSGAPEATLGVLSAAGRKANAREPGGVLGGAGAQGSPKALTMAGYALGARSPDEEGEGLHSEKHVLTLGPGSGTTEARRRIAEELLAQRTLAEMRSAWDALDAGDKGAIQRRLARARHLRKVLLEKGLVDLGRMDSLPDVETIEEAMLGAAAGAREARRKFTSWAHNTQVSFVGPSPIRDPKKK